MERLPEMVSRSYAKSPTLAAGDGHRGNMRGDTDLGIDLPRPPGTVGIHQTRSRQFLLQKHVSVSFGHKSNGRVACTGRSVADVTGGVTRGAQAEAVTAAKIAKDNVLVRLPSTLFPLVRELKPAPCNGIRVPSGRFAKTNRWSVGRDVREWGRLASSKRQAAGVVERGRNPALDCWLRHTFFPR